MKRTFWKWLWIATAVLFAGAAAADLSLFNYVWKYYKESQGLRVDPGNLGRYAVANRELLLRPIGQKRIVMFGDSTISEWNPVPAVKDYEVINRGIAGQTTAQIMLRLEQDVQALKPRAVIVHAGINDVKTIGLWPECREKIISACQENLQAIVQELRSGGAIVVILTLFPPAPPGVFWQAAWSEDIPGSVDEVNRFIRGMEERGVCVVDCDELFRHAGGMRREYARGTFHLNAAGYAALNRYMEKRLERVLADAKGND